MEDYPSNSHKSREQKEEREKVEKIVINPVVSKKKNGLERLLGQIFSSEDSVDIKSVILSDVIIPLIKTGLSNTLDTILYPRGNPDRRSTASRISYWTPTNMTRAPETRGCSSNQQQTYDYNSYGIKTRGEADEILSRMNEIIDHYGIVRVADFYEMLGVTGNFTDNDYGWNDIHSAQICHTRDGFVIKFPRALPLK